MPLPLCKPMHGLRDAFNWISAGIQSVMPLHRRMATYRFQETNMVPIQGAYTDKIVGHAPTLTYRWAEARRINKGQYMILRIAERRHGLPAVSGSRIYRESPQSFKGRQILDLTDAREGLGMIEKEYQSAYALSRFQPLKALHYS